ncbi:uncharacterized protein LOC127158092 [Labeo rohita]|uniref:uncharacterized protein LOC127158092 n=1 Tax=Labeo rohita TaxID=84645 RepID=UPI0021E348F3|nr:uncharacterized protein LOC127158092 [Labeo rohita]
MEPVPGSALSLRHGCRCVPDEGVTVEDLLVVIGEQLGFENIVSASRMYKAIVVFLKSEALVNQLTVSGVWVKESFVPVTPLSAPETKITVSNVPPFISNDAIIKELGRFEPVENTTNDDNNAGGSSNVEPVENVIDDDNKIGGGSNEESVLNITDGKMAEGMDEIGGLEENLTDGSEAMSQMTDDGEQWSDIQRDDAQDLYTVDEINAFLDETKGKSGLVDVVDNEVQEVKELVEENEAQGAEEVVELMEENDSRTDSVILNDEKLETVVKNSEDVENFRPTTSGESGAGKDEIEDNCNEEMRDEDVLSEISDIGTRFISLLSVEGKIFFKIMSQRLMEYLLKNGYIDTSVQKGGVPGVPGCLEHTGVVTQLIREARESRGDLATLWLDLTNAYGSIPHKLVEIALTRHHVPENITNLILDYYNNFLLRVTSGSSTSAWQRLEKGIITGCTISVPLFSLAMNMIVKSAEVECRGPLSKSGTRQPPIRAFMDDLTVTTTSVPGCRWLLQGLERLVSWARMSFKPAKSRSLVLKKGKVVDRFRFAIGGTPIPSVTEKSVKSLGKVFNSSLRDTDALQQTRADLTTWLAAIDKSGLPGKFKTWIYQHGVLPRILWPLLVYETPISTVEKLERTISQFLRRWLGLPRSLSSIALYGHSTMLQLPISGLSEEFKVTRARELMMYRDSSDKKVASAGILVKTGRKWKAQEAVNRAEARLQHSVLVGNSAVGRAGLGSFPKPRYDKARGREKRQMVQDEVRAEVEEDRRIKMVAMYQQGAWTRWEHAEQRKVTWSELWRREPQHIKFLIQSVYDVLPSPTNLLCWGLSDTAACQLCNKRGTLEHILSCCPKALSEGRYRWRHDQVLRALADIVSTAIINCKYQHTPKKSITFVRAGEKAQQRQSPPRGLLNTAQDWKLQVDLGRQLKFPEYILSTSLRPDMVITSDASKQVVLVELTVPWEDRMEEAHERKRAKYAEIVVECRNKGWKARCEPVEVGCRGFAGQSLPRTLKLLGVKGQLCRRAIKTIIEAAEKASRWLWIQRGDPWSSGQLGHKSGADHPRLGRPSEGV